MNYKVGDRVVLNNELGPYVWSSDLSLNKEYTILKIYEGTYETYYSIKNDNGDDELIYDPFIILSPTYSREQSINEILN